MPKFWVDKLNAAVAAKKIPDIPPSNASIYPPGVDPISAQVCSGTYKCIIPGDIWEGPDGVFASSFDDGPTLVCCFNFFFFAKNSSVTIIQISLPPTFCPFWHPKMCQQLISWSAITCLFIYHNFWILWMLVMISLFILGPTHIWLV